MTYFHHTTNNPPRFLQAAWSSEWWGLQTDYVDTLSRGGDSSVVGKTNKNMILWRKPMPFVNIKKIHITSSNCQSETILFTVASNQRWSYIHCCLKYIIKIRLFISAVKCPHKKAKGCQTEWMLISIQFLIIYIVGLTEGRNARWIIPFIPVAVVYGDCWMQASWWSETFES
jgi:hypothetical protein